MNASDANVSTASTTARCGGLPASRRSQRRSCLCTADASSPRPRNHSPSGNRAGGVARPDRMARRLARRRGGGQDTTSAERPERSAPRRGESNARPRRRRHRVLPFSLLAPPRRAGRGARSRPALAGADLGHAGLVAGIAVTSPAGQHRSAAIASLGGWPWKHSARPRVYGAWVLMTSRPTCRPELSSSSIRRGPSWRLAASIPPASCRGRSCAWHRFSDTSPGSNVAAASGSANGANAIANARGTRRRQVGDATRNRSHAIANRSIQSLGRLARSLLK